MSSAASTGRASALARRAVRTVRGELPAGLAGAPCDRVLAACALDLSVLADLLDGLFSTTAPDAGRAGVAPEKAGVFSLPVRHVPEVPRSVQRGSAVLRRSQRSRDGRITASDAAGADAAAPGGAERPISVPRGSDAIAPDSAERANGAGALGLLGAYAQSSAADLGQRVAANFSTSAARRAPVSDTVGAPSAVSSVPGGEAGGVTDRAIPSGPSLRELLPTIGARRVRAAAESTPNAPAADSGPALGWGPLGSNAGSALRGIGASPSQAPYSGFKSPAGSAPGAVDAGGTRLPATARGVLATSVAAHAGAAHTSSAATADPGVTHTSSAATADSGITHASSPAADPISGPIDIADTRESGRASPSFAVAASPSAADLFAPGLKSDPRAFLGAVPEPAVDMPGRGERRPDVSETLGAYAARTILAAHAGEQTAARAVFQDWANALFVAGTGPGDPLPATAGLLAGDSPISAARLLDELASAAGRQSPGRAAAAKAGGLTAPLVGRVGAGSRLPGEGEAATGQNWRSQADPSVSDPGAGGRGGLVVRGGRRPAGDVHEPRRDPSAWPDDLDDPDLNADTAADGRWDRRGAEGWANDSQTHTGADAAERRHNGAEYRAASLEAEAMADLIGPRGGEYHAASLEAEVIADLVGPRGAEHHAASPEAEAVAELVNQVLVEQARLHGVDLS